jgi:hypothetical protein
VATLVAGNANEAMMTSVVGSGGVSSQAVCFCVGEFGRNTASVQLGQLISGKRRRTFLYSAASNSGHVFSV